MVRFAGFISIEPFDGTAWRRPSNFHAESRRMRRMRSTPRTPRDLVLLNLSFPAECSEAARREGIAPMLAGDDNGCALLEQHHAPGPGRKPVMTSGIAVTPPMFAVATK